MKRPIFSNIILLLVAVLVMLVGCEMFLRFMKPQVFDPHPPGMYVADSRVGYILAPNFDGCFLQPEFRTHVKTNTLGLRDEDPHPRQWNSVRILCIGDSFTWGWGTTNEQAYPQLIEQLLESHYEQLDIQVLNAGVPGFGNIEELELLKKIGFTIDPDLVIVQFFAGNDFIENMMPARLRCEIRNSMLYDNLAYIDPSARSKWKQAEAWLRQKSHLACLLSGRMRFLAMRFGFLDDLAKPSSENFSEKDERKAKELLFQITALVRDLGAECLLVFVPEKLQVFSNQKPPLRAARVVQDAARKAGVPWIDLTPVLLNHPERYELYYTVDAHWTPIGHKVVAEILYKRIVDLGFIVPRLVN